MSTVATVEQLATFMKVSVDTDQAQLMLDVVEGLASSYADPLPPSALGVILTAAARAVPNPSGTSSESLGGASASWGGGAYLTRSERMTLRRLAGNGRGAFSVNVAPEAGKRYRDSLRDARENLERFVLDEDVP